MNRLALEPMFTGNNMRYSNVGRRLEECLREVMDFELCE